MDALLQVTDLNIELNTLAGWKNALEGVSFDVRRGESLGLVGESGCGKSLSAHAVMGLLPPTISRIAGGSVRFDGAELLGANQRKLRGVRGRRISLISQDPLSSLNPLMSVGRQVSEPLKRHLGMSARDATKRVIELLTLVGLPDPAVRINSFPHELSGGMRQRVAIAMALACSPDLILADEITTALDVTIQAQVLELVKGLIRDLDMACIMISHDLGVIAGMTDRVMVMYAGRVVESASTLDLFAEPLMPYTWGLLSSTPSIESESGNSVRAIEGSPPDITARPAGCMFAPRCPFARDVCHSTEPPLVAAGTGDGHRVRCWGAQEGEGLGWLRGKRYVNGRVEAGAAVAPRGASVDATVGGEL